jgi:hypothetical protein
MINTKTAPAMDVEAIKKEIGFSAKCISNNLARFS